MNRIATGILTLVGVQALPLQELISTHGKDRSHNSNEYTGHVKFDPRDWETQTAKSVGNYTHEKVDLIGAEVTVLTSYEYDSGLLRVFGSIDKKFQWAQKEERPRSKKQVKKKVYITSADKCASEWDKDDLCTCSGSVYFGTWGSIMLETEQSMIEKRLTRKLDAQEAPLEMTQFLELERNVIVKNLKN